MEKLTKEEWIERCANHYVEIAGLEKEDALVYAEACYDNDDADDISPEDAANEDMSYWDE